MCMTLPTAVQGDDCLPPLPQHSRCTAAYSTGGLLQPALPALALCHPSARTREAVKVDLTDLQNHRMSGDSVPCISLIPRNTALWPPSPPPFWSYLYAGICSP